MRTAVRPRILLLAMSIVLLISACGTSGSKDDAKKKPKRSTTTQVPVAPSTTTTTEPSTTEPSTTGPGSTAPSGSAEARARLANIRAGDLPSGWSGAPSSQDSSVGTFNLCAPDVRLEAVTVAKARSEKFSKGTNDAGMRISSVSRVLDSEKTARKVLQTFKRVSFVRCLDAQLKKTTSGTISGSLEMSRAARSYGEESAGITGMISVENNPAKPLRVQVGLLAIRTGDIVTVLDVEAVAADADAKLLVVLARLVAARQSG